MSKERNLPEVFDLLEVLGEHLFCKISELSPSLDNTKVGKITGILLECPKNEIFCMLERTDLLKKRIDVVLKSLEYLKFENSSRNQEDGDLTSHSEVDDGLAERLFDQVASLEPELCSQITGMLLELDEAELRSILTCQTRLSEAVLKAKSAYNATTQMKDLTLDDIGEMIFDIVQESYPENAAKISGMLLEMNLEKLKKLLQDRAALKIKIDEAANALCDSAIS